MKRSPLKRSTTEIKRKKKLSGHGFYGRNAKGKADRYFSQIVRARGACENCGKQPPAVKLECAHIFDRWYSNTRVMMINAFCLCHACHRMFTNRPVDFATFAEEKLGKETVEHLGELARPVAKMDWNYEVEELRKYAKEFGIELK